jgi:uncharacterized protein (TIGR03643 family)
MKKADPPADPSNAIRMSASDVSAVIGMAWQDDTPFEAMALQFGLSEAQVIALMREHLKARSFRLWRMRVRGRASKHQALQKTQSRTGAHSALGAGPHDAFSDSYPFALPVTGVTVSSLR